MKKSFVHIVLCLGFAFLPALAAHAQTPEDAADAVDNAAVNTASLPADTEAATDNSAANPVDSSVPDTRVPSMDANIAPANTDTSTDNTPADISTDSTDNQGPANLTDTGTFIGDNAVVSPSGNGQTFDNTEIMNTLQN
ncbi:MAG: hypothetical protein KGK03_01520 [Candidatus Omnitrophica bacterium]|nr:hypothetical protein [Candidatus Omnitrophota bacterium]MDE2221729.1 hypothetical protein [Candidatus Omnitrophota bacterium]